MLEGKDARANLPDTRNRTPGHFLDAGRPPSALSAMAEDVGALVEVEKARAIQEVQAAFVMARQFPRDFIAAETKIVKECQRFGMAKKGLYKYKKGKEVEGLTIRAAEMLASNWGNLQYGWREVSRRRGQSDVEAFCWDLETNVKSLRQFTVEHSLKADNKIKYLTDPRDIYEWIANNAQRRTRACILERIPGDIQERAMEIIKKTLVAGLPKDRSLLEQVKAAVMGFESSFQVKQAHLEKYLDHGIDLTTAAELADLIGIFNALKEGHAKREDYFDLGLKSETGGPAGELKERLKNGTGESVTSAALSPDELMPFEKGGGDGIR